MPSSKLLLVLAGILRYPVFAKTKKQTLLPQDELDDTLPDLTSSSTSVCCSRAQPLTPCPDSTGRGPTASVPTPQITDTGSF